MPEHVINCDADPVVPAYMTGMRPFSEREQLHSRVRGMFAWDPARVELHLVKGQRGDGKLYSPHVKDGLMTAPVFPARGLLLTA